ncbi:hypothetical protein C9374_013506 [Naegleria lovaniensis]|uniref:Palmitoyltransferase DHHC domain-containing protein n=1 Tax=Naegleria lovaniensis TaxID=51637 RepID=A0AA88H2T7_NAELO|nr:uncharacterized protein C9374_013506 [Naegleria lovaniensis]KAG2392021.1 hypothetical protein C9374_013506 [Naegleria lovaniensis]
MLQTTTHQHHENTSMNTTSEFNSHRSLFYAIHSHNTSLLREILTQTCSSSSLHLSRDESRRALPLHWACYYGYNDMIELLLQTSSSDSEIFQQLMATTQDDALQTPFMWAIQGGNLKTVQLLVHLYSKYIYVNTTILNTTKSQIRNEWRRDHDVLKQLFINHVQQDSKYNILIMAIQDHHTCLVQYLMHHLLLRDEEQQNNEDQQSSLLDMTEIIFMMDDTTMKHLYSNPQYLDKENHTILHWACYQGHLSHVKFIIQFLKFYYVNGSKMDANNVHPCRTMEKDLQFYEHMFQLLTAKDSSHRTIFHWVARKGYFNIMKYILLELLETQKMIQHFQAFSNQPSQMTEIASVTEVLMNEKDHMNSTVMDYLHQSLVDDPNNEDLHSYWNRLKMKETVEELLHLYQHGRVYNELEQTTLNHPQQSFEDEAVTNHYSSEQSLLMHSSMSSPFEKSTAHLFHNPERLLTSHVNSLLSPVETGSSSESTKNLSILKSLLSSQNNEYSTSSVMRKARKRLWLTFGIFPIIFVILNVFSPIWIFLLSLIIGIGYLFMSQPNNLRSLIFNSPIINTPTSSLSGNHQHHSSHTKKDVFYIGLFLGSTLFYCLTWLFSIYPRFVNPNQTWISQFLILVLFLSFIIYATYLWYQLTFKANPGYYQPLLINNNNNNTMNSHSAIDSIFFRRDGFHVLESTSNDSSNNHEEENISLPSLSGSNFCKELLIRKPLRSKYDRMSDQIICRFDHYCAYTLNSIGEKNHVMFMKFVTCVLVATFIYCYCGWSVLLTFSSHPVGTAKGNVEQENDGMFSWISTFLRENIHVLIPTCYFALFLIFSFVLWTQQVFLILFNNTAFEMMRPDKHVYIIPTKQYLKYLMAKVEIYTNNPNLIMVAKFFFKAFNPRTYQLNLFDRGILENIREFIQSDQDNNMPSRYASIFQLELNPFVSDFCQKHEISIPSAMRGENV